MRYLSREEEQRWYREYQTGKRQEAEQVLFNSVYDWIRTICRKYAKNKDEYHEMIQVASTVVVEHCLPKYDGEHRLTTYITLRVRGELIRMIQRRIKNRNRSLRLEERREHGTRRTDDNHLLAHEHEFPNPDIDFIRKTLDEALGLLHPHWAECIRLQMQGLDYRRIAPKVGMTEQGVRLAVIESKKHIRNYFEKVTDYYAEEA